jgi:hypothetical protein
MAVSYDGGHRGAMIARLHRHRGHYRPRRLHPGERALDSAQTKPSTLFAAESALQDSTAAAPSHDPGAALGARPIVRN